LRARRDIGGFSEASQPLSSRRRDGSDALLDGGIIQSGRLGKGRLGTADPARDAASRGHDAILTYASDKDIVIGKGTGTDMKALVKIGTVLAGYVAAVLVANAAVAVRFAHTCGTDAQASPGMYAFGEGLLFIAVFGAVALVPTGLALWFLRPFRWFWVSLSITAVAIAGTAIPLAGAFLVAGVLAPTWASRWALVAAAGIEGAVAAYAVLQWFVGCCFT
jgi:hypothetical protein